VNYTEYQNPESFLDATQRALEENEVLYGLMLGISKRLLKNPLHYGTQPLLSTITSENKLHLIALMTPPYKLQIISLSPDPAPAITLLASNLHKNGWAVPGVMAEETIAKQFEQEWNQLTTGQSEDGLRLRIHELRAVNTLDHPRGHLRQTTMDDLERVARWCNAFYIDCPDGSRPKQQAENAKRIVEEGSLYFWEDPLPVSMAAFARPTIRGTTIGYVYTPPEFRRKGYASAIVATLSKQAMESGKEYCTLYTDLSNPTSNSIYKKIGYRGIEDVLNIRFIH
jgi:predicted GNAT family acetyltransferase